MVREPSSPATVGTVFDIQHASIYDGPGLRTTVFLKGCPLRCRWCHNPESWSPHPEPAHAATRCTSCGACVAACPSRALVLRSGRPIRDRDACTRCLVCTVACPAGAMEPIGRTMTIDEVMEEVMADQPFYDTSGGGLTVTGGEPTVQPRFLLELLAKAREQGIDTAVETTGMFPSSLIAPLAEVTDRFLFDLKGVDPEVHRASTGVDNGQILSRFEALLDLVGGVRLTPRIPLVPGVTMSAGAIDALTVFLRRVGFVGEVQLMPYNDLAADKWRRLGLDPPRIELPRAHDATIQRLAGRIEATGLGVHVSW